MIPTIQNSFISGELSPSLLGRTDKAQYRNGASTMRNFFVNYRGGAASRAGFKYVGMCKQGAPNAGGTSTANPPRDIPFQFSISQGFALEFGDQYMRVKYQGSYVTETAKNVSAITQANPGVITIAAHGYNNGDWVYGSGIGGMTAFNGLTWIVQNVTANTFTLTDLFGNVVNTTAYPAFTSGGTFARIYTVAAPYAAIDLQYLKYTQSANTMNLTCWNQQTLSEYIPYDLQRVTNTNWVFTAVSFTSPIAAPNGVNATASNSTTINTWYSYRVTAVDVNGNESAASIGLSDVANNDISIYAGSNSITWQAVPGATSYNVYAATPIFTNTSTPDPGFIGVPYGLIGTAFGLEFVDTNITPDFTISPPLHKNPFARGAITAVTVMSGGSGGTQTGTSYTINTSTGSGFTGYPIVQSGSLTGFVVTYGGQNYAPSDTITITGMVASAVLTIGPESGTYPGVAQYYQQRLVYADTINQPDTYFMSQTGSYANFDSSIPVVDSDAITGTPWGQQINGIQFMVPTINGLLTFTGNGVWLINGGNNAAITPSDQNAQAQAQIGCSAIVPPIYINLHILYVQAKNSVVRDISYNFLYNVFQGTDITVFSNHLFFGYTILQWAYSEEPWKIVWAVRDDGAMLSLTYMKEQEVEGWARHDTNGQFVGVCSVIEPPVDAIYVITKRYIKAYNEYVYYSERADNRQWANNVEECFCVDAGLSYPMLFPNATLFPNAATGTNNITGINLINGGTGYTAPVITAVDPTGAGSGATFSYTLSGGVITAITPTAGGSNYAQGTYLNITDSTGIGAVAQAIVTNNVVFTANANVFNAGMVGNILRVDGGKATIVTYTSATQVVANVTQPLTTTFPDDPYNLPVPALSGSWSISVPTTIVTGLNHLEGMTVSILADGGVMPPQIVTNGVITLQTAASQIVVGLPYICQLQSFYLEAPAQTTTQGARKNISSVIVRVEASRGLQVGANQVDASTQPNNANVPWTNMSAVKERNALIDAGANIPLFTGDIDPEYITSDWNSKGQVAIQQINPLPANILAVIPQTSLGDPAG